MKFSILKMLLISLVAVLFTGCENADDEDGSGGGAPVPGVVDANGGFNIKMNPQPNTNYYIHKDGDFAAPCVVAPGATAHVDRDLYCTVEVEELEGAFVAADDEGLQMVMNSPPGMCRYVRYTPYYYFGRNYGQGPTAVVVNRDVDGNFIPGTSSITGPGYFTSDGTAICNYDYSPSNGPDCCYGSYTLTDAGTTSTQEWQGKPGNCVGGSGSLADRDPITGLPLSTIYSGPNGFNDEFVTGKLGFISFNHSSLFYANYFSGPTPTAFNMAGVYPGSPYYEWECLDEAQELNARIRLRIREWNEVVEFDLGSAGDPDTTGLETNWGQNINDYIDWLDVVNSGNGYPGLPLP